MRCVEEVNRAIEKYADTVRRICIVHQKNNADTEDIFQTVFLKYVLSSVSFESEEHEKAWFHLCDGECLQRSSEKFFPQPDGVAGRTGEKPSQMPQDNREVLEAVLELPAKYRDVVILIIMRNIRRRRSDVFWGKKKTLSTLC